MINHVLDKIAPIEGIERVYVVTNAKFAAQFQAWSDSPLANASKLPLTIVNDGSIDDKTKLGAIGDLHFVLQREKIDDDILVVAGDNLFSQTLGGFGKFCREKNAPVLGVYDVGTLEEAKKYNDIKLDENGRISQFIEKPQQPTGTLIAIALYYYPRDILPLIRQYVAEGNNPDQPGRLVQWLHPRTPVFTWKVPGIWLDIGSKETLEEANRRFA